MQQGLTMTDMAFCALKHARPYVVVTNQPFHEQQVLVDTSSKAPGREDWTLARGGGWFWDKVKGE